MQASPMWPNTVRILVAEAPATSIAKERRKFPAGVLVPGISG